MKGTDGTTPHRAWWFDGWMFTGLWLWMGILKVIRPAPEAWLVFGRTLVFYGVVMLPPMAFAWCRAWLKERLSAKQYRWCWLLCFAVLLPAAAAGMALLRPPGHYPDDFVLCALLSILLELVLLAVRYQQRLPASVRWIGKISLEKAVLATIVMICLVLSLMAASSLGDPQYHTPEQLLIGFEFRPGRIVRHAGFFLGFFAQLLLIYMAGYFFFYINNRLLVARVLKEKGIVAYVLGVFAVVGLCYPVLGQLLAWLPANRLMGGLFSLNAFHPENALAALFIIFFSLPIVLALQWGRQNNRIMHLEKEKTEAELGLLRQQLNPHFFFNTLNNLYAMSLQQSRQTPESILQLSGLMRYVIYKGQETAVPVRDEIRYLEDYIRLQSIRLKNQPVIQFEQQVSDQAPMIAPLLLIVLVENAFKHGIEPAENTASLVMRLISTARELHFCCENTLEEAPASTGGIGLSNLRKRLELLYPGRHQLKTGVKNHTFKAELQITFP